MATIDETSRGQVRLDGNEHLTDAKGPAERAEPDPAKNRVGSPYVPGRCGGGGAYSHDIIDRVGAGQRRVEAVLRTGGFNGKTGESKLIIWNGRDFGDIRDSDQVTVYEATSERVEFKVPISAPNLGGGGGQYLEKYSHDAASGRTLMFNPQADKAWPLGVIIVYDITSGTPVPVGKIRVEPL